MKIEFHPATVSDLNRAVTYYESLRPGLGRECRSEVYKAIDRIRAAPRRYRTVEQDIRRSFVGRFPFSILYRIIGTERIRVLVIRHHRQRDDLGRNRR